MTKQQNKKLEKKNNRLIQIVTGIVVLAFIALMMSDFFISKPNKILKPMKNSKVKNTFEFKKDGELTFQTKEGSFISSIDLEFAETTKERTQGLMYRTEMKENQGMLFIFPEEQMQSFWMHNTVLPLDMIFINSNLEIVTIRKNTKPYDDSSYPSTKPAQYVVEVNAGYADKYNIKVGDKVVFRRIN